MKSITVETIVHSDSEKVWNFWTDPMHIEKWNYASPDWECPHAENDVRVGGRFVFTMRAKDGSSSFDFAGRYTEVTPFSLLSYTLDGDDGRKVAVRFLKMEKGIHIAETFELESINSEELQRAGWRAILNNFKQHTEMHQ